jgi:hypothetical protein
MDVRSVGNGKHEKSRELNDVFSTRRSLWNIEGTLWMALPVDTGW